MPDTLWDSVARERLISRLASLRPDTPAKWGKFTAPRMLAHVTDWMRMAAGEITAKPRPGILRLGPVRHLAIYYLPFPKGVPTAPELLSRAPEEWSAECGVLRSYLEQFEKRHRAIGFPEHPAFGNLSPEAWGVLGYRHTDHHFRQFGI